MSDREVEPEADGSRYKMRVTLRIRDTNISPNDITVALGIEPKATYVKGDHLRIKNRPDYQGRLFESTYWAAELLSGQCPPNWLGDTLEGLVARLEQRADFFAALKRDGGRAEFFIGWFMKGAGGLHLSAALMGRLVALGIALDLDVYHDNG